MWRMCKRIWCVRPVSRLSFTSEKVSLISFFGPAGFGSGCGFDPRGAWFQLRGDPDPRGASSPPRRRPRSCGGPRSARRFRPRAVCPSRSCATPSGERFVAGDGALAVRAHGEHARPAGDFTMGASTTPLSGSGEPVQTAR